jgi:hypothetical protein
VGSLLLIVSAFVVFNAYAAEGGEPLNDGWKHSTLREKIGRIVIITRISGEV